MIREILKMGDPRLLRIAPPVPDTMIGTASMHSLIADMFTTMRDVGGVGLAAPQIGVNLQLLVLGFEHSERYPNAPAVPATVLINPVIEPLSQEMEEDWEGCLSIPDLRGAVNRYKRIAYRAVTAQGEPIESTAEGFHARIIQHEYDHLIGRLYPSRITDFGKFGWTSVLFPDMPKQALVQD